MKKQKIEIYKINKITWKFENSKDLTFKHAVCEVGSSFQNLTRTSMKDK